MILRRAPLPLLILLFAIACSRPKPSIILISIDTLRSDHIGAYGSRDARTPNLDRFAKDSLVARSAWSHCPLTLPSHLSMFTGLLPPEHGVRDNTGYRFDTRAHRTIASLLRADGYATAAAVSAYVLRRDTGLAEGFDEFDDSIGIVDGVPVGSLQRDGATTAEIARRWIDQHRSKPFFYFLHLYEPHSPYASTYRDDVATADAVLGDFVHFLQKEKLYDDALIIVTSDHGEGLNDHGEEEHGVFLYREALQVPLMVKFPHSRHAGMVDHSVQLIDLFPTIAEAAGSRISGMRGESILSAKPERSIYAESFYPRIHFGWSELRSIVRGNHQLIEAPKPELYDVAIDRGQKRNLAAVERRVFAALRRELGTFGAAFAAPDVIPPEEQKNLAALGYVSAGGDAEESNIDPKDEIGELARLKQLFETSRGDEAKTIALASEILRTHPRWTDVREALAAACNRQGDHRRAADVYEEGIRVTPRLAGEFAFAAATSALEGNDLARALQNATLARERGIAGADLILAEIALLRGDHGEALRFARAAGLSPAQRAHARFVEARIAVARRSYAEALELLSDVETLRRASNESIPQRFHYVRGDTLAHLGRFAEARASLEQEVKRDPHFIQAWGDLALVSWMLRDVDAARRTLEQMWSANRDPEVARYAQATSERWGLKQDVATWSARASESSK